VTGNRHPSGPHLDDDELSAVLDASDATGGRLDHLGSCDQCAARLGDLRRVAALVAVPPEIDELVRVRAIRSAMAAYDEAHPPPELAHSDRSGGRWGSIALRAAAAAAVIALAAGAVELVRAGHGSSSHSSSASSATSVPGHNPAAGTVNPQSEPTSTVPESAAASSGASEGPIYAVLNAPPGARGGFDSPAAVVAAVEPELPSRASTAPSPSAPTTVVTSCVSQAAGASSEPGAAPVYIASLSYSGRAALAFVFATAGGHTLVVVATSDCVLLGQARF
jgi:hypothetical protein